MPFDTQTRNRLARFVTDAREMLAAEFTQQLQGVYGISVSGEATPLSDLTHLDEEQRALAELLRDRLQYLKASSSSERNPAAAAVDRLTREQAFTVLNRLAAIRMGEKRGFIVESVGRGYQSKGFQVYSQVAGSTLGDTYHRYRSYLFCLSDELALDLRALFDRRSPLGLLFPRETCLQRLLQLINSQDINAFWSEDETIGWIYQYYNDEAERRRMREQSAAPRNSRELAVRNQFFTPRYVVEFLVDNTLGRSWYEERKGNTALTEMCRYLVRRPSESFLAEGESSPPSLGASESLNNEELLKQHAYVPHRPQKDPRDLKILDPACGSGHFLLYSFDLLETIYEEAWADGPVPSVVTGRSIREDYPDLHELRKAMPELIIRHNLHGMDIDLRACQIAALALWLRAQRTYERQNMKLAERPNISRSNIVCGEPMPGERHLLDEFLADLQPKLLGQLVQVVFEKMRLAGDAGSLLRIEDEISSAVADAKRLWLAGPRAEQGRLFAKDPEPRQLGFDLTGITDANFWDKAEERIYAALESYAEHAESGDGYQRRLFAHDTARGFSFIDLCRKRYDLVLMNPPFGSFSTSTRGWAADAYARTSNDIYSAFVERGISLLSSGGMLGAITSRTGFFLSSFQKWREEILLKSAWPTVFVDLGHGVLDNAMVEVAAYCLGSNCATSVFYRLLAASDKASALQQAIHDVELESQKNTRFVLNPQSFRDVPRSPFAYWVPSTLRQAFKQHPPLKNETRFAARGPYTLDDFRFVRLRWEAPVSSIKSARNETANAVAWVRFLKGGSFARFYSDPYLLLKWSRDGAELKASVSAYRDAKGWGPNWTAAINGHDYYFQPGLTWTHRTTSNLSLRAMPAGCIFSAKGPALIVSDEAERLALLSICNSATFRAVFALSLGAADAAARSYDVGIMQRVPIPVLQTELVSAGAKLALRGWDLARKINTDEETSHAFRLPSLLQVPGTLLIQRAGEWRETVAGIVSQLKQIDREVDELSFHAYGIEDQSKSAIEDVGLDAVDGSGDRADDDGDNDELAKTGTDTSPASMVAALVSWCVGVAFGRFDLRILDGKSEVTTCPGPFDKLPVCSKGELANTEGLPLSPEQGRLLRDEGAYPLDVVWDGILVDDAENSNDIVDRVREVLNVIWKERAETVEHEACDLLTVPDLREYLRKPSLFFADHLKQYSRSRRQAPIYWPLSTPSGRYTLWLYYPRLTAQTLHQCLADFLSPKLKSISTEIQTLRSSNGSQSRLEELLDLQDELNSMRAEIERILRLPYMPNLHDGGLITACPLWKLFRLQKWQKDLKNCWEELESGVYDWSHLALSIWPDRVSQRCKTDRSLAIAHEMEYLCEIEQAGPKAKKPRKKQATLVDEGAR